MSFLLGATRNGLVEGRSADLHPGAKVVSRQAGRLLLSFEFPLGVCFYLFIYLFTDKVVLVLPSDIEFNTTN